MKFGTLVIRTLLIVLLSLSPLLFWFWWKNYREEEKIPPTAWIAEESAKTSYQTGPDIFREPRIWRTQDNKEINLQDLRGQIYVTSFIYTRCFQECLLTVLDLKRIEKLLGEEKQKVRFLVFSFDPENDTPEKMLQYAGQFDVSMERWLFLTSSPKELTKLTQDFQFRFEKSKAFFNHDITIAIVDKKGMIRRQFFGNYPNNKQIVQEIKKFW